MPSIDTGALLRDIGTAALGAVGAGWPKIRDFASDELQKIAETSARIEVDKRNGDITEDEAASLVRICASTPCVASCSAPKVFRPLPWKQRSTR